jgi:hypothetical protein
MLGLFLPFGAFSNFVTDHALFPTYGKDWTSYLALLA